MHIIQYNTLKKEITTGKRKKKTNRETKRQNERY